MASITANDIAFGFTPIIGSLLIYSGIKGTFINPLEWAKGYGLPTATAETVVVFPAATGRNLGAGFFVWAMIVAGQRTTLGVFLTCWAWAGVTDTMILIRHPRGTNVAMHARNTAILLILGPFLAWSSR
ncbi:hypothetical protein K505DRAFT_240861 [Melanomma pulvis-pyrius CBS 109.77]|uniref:DUF4267 domain-containing protein n=1 Tax=Melanomma pulvis-pyrius CBS 109.77 TaxID=1314802 RepID=A0A6A6XFV4_9PLEO|nr:hypothetical protein K505DRAFT_240861 [Melanomma pulvis-pyrius CBS 109.77]